jgi:hypothetical protein
MFLLELCLPFQQLIWGSIELLQVFPTLANHVISSLQEFFLR